MKEKTSLEKSHSKLSNTKLTLICLFACILEAVLWIGVGVIIKYQTLGIILIVVGVVLAIPTILLTKNFRR